MRKRWFGSVKHGIGWYPITWQSWIIVIIYLLFIVWDFIRLQNDSKTLTDTIIRFLPEFGIATAIFAFICYFTGEKPKV